MKIFSTVLLCLGTISLTRSAPAPQPKPRDSSPQHVEYDYEYENSQPAAQEPQESASHYDAYIEDVQAAASGRASPAKKGFSQGSGLRTIAVGSANQAKTALGNQHAAAQQAAYVAKNTLAQSAAQASATAQAALAGKQVILSGLEQQVRDAKVGLQGEEMQLQQAKRAAQSAAQAAQQAMHQVNVIQAALNAAQATSENANEAASQAAGELGAQTAMVGAARQRLHTLQEQLHGVRIDFEATQAAARKAQAAAQQAQANAAEAAAKAAAAGLAAGQPHHDSSHEGWYNLAPELLNLQESRKEVKQAEKPIRLEDIDDELNFAEELSSEAQTPSPFKKPTTSVAKPSNAVNSEKTKIKLVSAANEHKEQSLEQSPVGESFELAEAFEYDSEIPVGNYEVVTPTSSPVKQVFEIKPNVQYVSSTSLTPQTPRQSAYEKLVQQVHHVKPIPQYVPGSSHNYTFTYPLKQVVDTKNYQFKLPGNQNYTYEYVSVPYPIPNSKLPANFPKPSYKVTPQPNFKLTPQRPNPFFDKIPTKPVPVTLQQQKLANINMKPTVFPNVLPYVAPKNFKSVEVPIRHIPLKTVPIKTAASHSKFVQYHQAPLKSGKVEYQLVPAAAASQSVQYVHNNPYPSGYELVDADAFARLLNFNTSAKKSPFGNQRRQFNLKSKRQRNLRDNTTVIRVKKVQA